MERIERLAMGKLKARRLRIAGEIAVKVNEMRMEIVELEVIREALLDGAKKKENKAR